MLAEIRTGPIASTDGAVNPGRADKTGASVVTDAHARYAEAVMRGTVFNACTSAAVIISNGLAAASTGLCLSNPIGSGKNLVLLELTVFPTVTASALATYVLCAQQSITTSGTAHTAVEKVRCALIGSSNVAVGTADSAYNLGTVPVPVRILGGSVTGSTICTFPTSTFVDGSIVVAPGAAISVQTIGISTSSFISMTWEEVSV